VRDIALLEKGLAMLFSGDPPLGLELWNGQRVGPDRPLRIVLRRPEAIRRMLVAPGELGLARAFVSGDLDVEGDLLELLGLRDRLVARAHRLRARRYPAAAVIALAAARLAGLGPIPPPPPEEVRLRGGRHSRRRDAAAIAHHYDEDPEFYRLFLGESLTYSCAYFPSPEASLDEAQTAKHELVCRKLGLRAGMRLLDIGCGFGSMVLHAARRYGVRAVGVTVSHTQALHARERVRAAGLDDRVEIREQDYRDLSDGPFDAISSIGMFEHVGLARTASYFRTLARLLRPGGRLLNHAISRPAGVPPRLPARSFAQRYVFPDGELLEVGSVVSAAQAAGLEVRDVESLREHYGRTLRRWSAALEARRDAAAALVGEGRARVFRLYIAGSALAFEAGRLSVHQVLAVRTDAEGRSYMPATRAELLGLDPLAVASLNPA
jgi:cyclopropane-fatty-acyl-phospholipid synthase